MSAPLKPCPFCGGDYLEEYPDDDCVICIDCACSGPSLTEDGIAAWNDRHMVVDRLIAEAVAAERERCAKVADDEFGGRLIAAKIRGEMQ